MKPKQTSHFSQSKKAQCLRLEGYKGGTIIAEKTKLSIINLKK